MNAKKDNKEQPTEEQMAAHEAEKAAGQQTTPPPAGPTEQAPDAEKAAEPTEPVPASEHDEEDVAAALKRQTADGAGFDSEDELPESDAPEEDSE